MKKNKKKYRNENWTILSDDINNFKYFQDDRFYITFNAYTNELWYNEDVDPFETLPELYILPEAFETLLDDFKDDDGGIKILLN